MGNKEGRGTFTMKSSGRHFDGEWLNNMPHGQVTETIDGGDTYVGTYEEGKRQGQGTLSLKNGKVYVGNFVDNMPNG